MPLMMCFALAMIQNQPVPADLSALANAARLDRPIVAWCRGEFRPGHDRAYAVAVAVSNGGGRYVLLEADAPVVELATFSGGPDISCYTPAAARELSLTIERSETIHGNVVPRWSTTVVCAFVESTRAVCWQYSPDSHAFEKIGEWTT